MKVKCDFCKNMVEADDAYVLVENAMCHSCYGDSGKADMTTGVADFINEAFAYIDGLRAELKKERLAIMATKPYCEFRPILKRTRWFIDIAYMNEKGIQTDHLAGDSKEEVEKALADLRKYMYGQA